MKAIIVNKPGDMRFVEVEKPGVGPWDVLVKVSFCGICGTDLAILSGDMSFVRDGLIKYPVRIGHEWSGIVEETGAEVTKVKPGDRVVGDNGVACEKCRNCLAGNYCNCLNSRAVGTVNCWDGGFAEYMLMPERHIYKLPDQIGLEEAALIEPASIAYSGVKAGGITRDSTVLVIGTGPIGLTAVAMARNAGVRKLMVAGRKDFKLEIGKRMGADTTINVTRESLKDAVMRETDGEGVSTVIETSGAISVINESLNCIAAAGIISLVGFYEKELNGFNIDKVVLNKIQIRGVAGEPVMQEIIDLIASGSIKLNPLITHKVNFDEAAISAFTNIKARDESKIKILVEM